MICMLKNLENNKFGSRQADVGVESSLARISCSFFDVGYCVYLCIQGTGQVQQNTAFEVAGTMYRYVAAYHHHLGTLRERWPLN